MNPGDINVEALLKRLHLPTMRRLYAEYATRAWPLPRCSGGSDATPKIRLRSEGLSLAG